MCEQLSSGADENSDVVFVAHHALRMFATGTARRLRTTVRMVYTTLWLVGEAMDRT
jgi:hypothetical protein